MMEETLILVHSLSNHWGPFLISDAIKAGRLRESLFFLGGIRNTGVNTSILTAQGGDKGTRAFVSTPLGLHRSARPSDRNGRT